MISRDSIYICKPAYQIYVYLPSTFQTRQHTSLRSPKNTTHIDLHLNMHMFIRTKTMCRRIPRHTLHVPYTSNLDSNIDRNMNRSSLDEYLQVWISRPHNTHIHLQPYIHTSHSYMHANTPKIEI